MTLTDVQKERMLLFVQALESGDYQQCQKTLTVVGEDGSKSHCCLGVATEVALANGLQGVKRQEGHEFIGSRQVKVEKYAYDSGSLRTTEANWLPDPVVEWYGFPSRNPNLEDPRMTRHLRTATSLNDDLELNFTEIAAWFRHNYGLGSREESGAGSSS